MLSCLNILCTKCEENAGMSWSGFELISPILSSISSTYKLPVALLVSLPLPRTNFLFTIFCFSRACVQIHLLFFSSNQFWQIFSFFFFFFILTKITLSKTKIGERCRGKCLKYRWKAWILVTWLLSNLDRDWQGVTNEHFCCFLDFKHWHLFFRLFLNSDCFSLFLFRGEDVVLFISADFRDDTLSLFIEKKIISSYQNKYLSKVSDSYYMQGL